MFCLRESVSESVELACFVRWACPMFGWLVVRMAPRLLRSSLNRAFVRSCHHPHSLSLSHTRTLISVPHLKSDPHDLGSSAFHRPLPFPSRVQIVEVNEDRQVIEPVFTLEHPYPATKLLFEPRPPDRPPPENGRGELLVSSSDYLRVWQADRDYAESVAVLGQVGSSSGCVCVF